MLEIFLWLFLATALTLFYKSLSTDEPFWPAVAGAFFGFLWITLIGEGVSIFSGVNSSGVFLYTAHTTANDLSIQFISYICLLGLFFSVYKFLLTAGREALSRIKW